MQKEYFLFRMSRWALSFGDRIPIRKEQVGENRLRVGRFLPLPAVALFSLRGHRKAAATLPVGSRMVEQTDIIATSSPIINKRMPPVIITISPPFGLPEEQIWPNAIPPFSQVPTLQPKSSPYFGWNQEEVTKNGPPLASRPISRAHVLFPKRSDTGENIPTDPVSAGEGEFNNMRLVHFCAVHSSAILDMCI